MCEFHNSNSNGLGDIWWTDKCSYFSSIDYYGSECWAVKKKDENKLNSAEMRMLKWARGKTRLDHIRNEDIRKEAHVKHVEMFLENKRLKWFGHCLRRERNHICAKSLRLEVSGRRSRGRPKKRWMDNIKGDVKKYQLTERTSSPDPLL